MDKVQQCAYNFLHLVKTTQYVFHLAKKGIRVITLDFELKDFYHLVGFQYLTDINIPKDKKKTIQWILSEKKPILKHRKGMESPCCIVSFCVKNNTTYGGQKLYWMLKDKIVSGNRITIYQHSNYSNEQKIENREKYEKIVKKC